MKILMVNKFLYPKGGSEVYMFKLSEYLVNQGHLIQFFGMADHRNTVNVDKVKLIGNVDFHQKTLKSLFYPFKIIYSFEARRKLAGILDDFHPDIVHLNNYNFQITPAIIYELKKRNIPVVQTVHDPVLICPAHSLYNFQSRKICELCKGHKYLNCIKTKCIHGSHARSLLGAMEGYLYYQLKTYDYIRYFICPSNFLAAKLIEYGFNPSKIRVLHNFIDYFEPVGTDEQVNRNYFLYFGRLSEEKGFRTLLQAIQKLSHIEFIIAGKGPLENMLNGYANLKYVGFKQGNELKSLIRGSVATIYPSEWYENCPMAILESMGIGTPVIGANIGGIPELIDNEETGLLFNPGDADQLAGKIRTLYENKDKVGEFSDKCKEKAKRFSIDLYYRKLQDIYSNSRENRR